jgi:hypothetical protein
MQFKWNYCGLYAQVDTVFFKAEEQPHSIFGLRRQSDWQKESELTKKTRQGGIGLGQLYILDDEYDDNNDDDDDVFFVNKIFFQNM